jgi:hypothetical protein
MNTAPTIMISSTFYDLHQIRSDISQFISEDLGYIPLLSELPSFPVDPDVDTIENCRRRVEQNTDVLILIIGGRYGSIDSKTDKSVTNLEFLAAKMKGIPIYAFVESSILSAFPIWKANPNGNYETSVDTTKVFEFIELVRNTERVWTFEFREAKDIITIIKIQLAYLVKESLRLKQLLSGSGIPHYLEILRPASLRIALERPKAWEHQLLFQSWIDEVENRSDLIREYKEGLRLEIPIFVPAFTASEWLLTQTHELELLIESINHIINVSINEAIGKPGEPGDIEYIVWISRMIGRILEHLILWANRIRSARCEPPFDNISQESALMVDEIIVQIITFPTESLQKLTEALEISKTGQPISFELTIPIRIANLSKIHEAIENAKKEFGIK